MYQRIRNHNLKAPRIRKCKSHISRNCLISKSQRIRNGQSQISKKPLSPHIKCPSCYYITQVSVMSNIYYTSRHIVTPDHGLNVRMTWSFISIITVVLTTLIDAVRAFEMHMLTLSAKFLEQNQGRFETFYVQAPSCTKDTFSRNLVYDKNIVCNTNVTWMIHLGTI